MKKNRTLFATLLSLLITSAGYAQSIQEIATPVSNPVNFEDPRIESDIRPIYAYHRIDDKFVTSGGDVRIYALQIRYALNDRWALIATKDGYVDMNPSAVLNDEEGWANVAGGAKYAFYKSEANDAIATAGLRYEAPIGESEVLQGQGDGIINPFLSAALVAGPVNVVGYTGLRVPFDDDDSTFYDASVHFDTSVCGVVSPLIELNYFHVLDGGGRLPIADEGQDFFNIGSSKATGENMLTMAAGARVPLAESVSFGAAYEFPLARGTGTHITEWRLTTDLRVTW